MICLLAFAVGYWVGVLKPPNLVLILSGGTEPVPKPTPVISPVLTPAHEARHGCHWGDEADAVAEARKILGLGDE